MMAQETIEGLRKELKLMEETQAFFHLLSTGFYKEIIIMKII